MRKMNTNNKSSNPSNGTRYVVVKAEMKKESESDRDPDMECGISSCRPKALSCFSNMLTFSFVYSFSGLFTSTVSIYISSQITTLEKYFGFNSSQTGFLMSCNDIGYLLTTLFISYHARTVHIPRVLSITTILFGISGIFCSLAYFLSPKSMTFTSSNAKENTTAVNMFFEKTQLCKAAYNDTNSTTDMCSEAENEQYKTGIPTEFTPVAMAIIAIGMIIQGFGKSPRQPFVTTYIDDNVKKTKTALYMGVIMAIGVFGPALAFATGGIFSRLYVTLEDVDITPTHPQWVGAWWVGFLFFGSLSLIAGLPLLFFPRRLQPKPKPKYGDKGTPKKLKSLKEWFRTMTRLLSNRLYVLSVLNGCLSLFVVASYIAFIPKYLETQFSIPTWQANMLMGALTICSACLGGFIGGALTSKFKLTPLACIKLLLGVNSFSLLTSFLGFVLGCPTPEIVGYNAFSYDSATNSSTSNSCQLGCFCDDTDYFPVCGSDGRTYFSPCHAGCLEEVNQTYINCGCISGLGTAEPGLCATECKMLYPYMAVTIVVAFIQTLTAMPGMIFALRSVPDKDKSLSVGLSSFMHTLLGFFPAPVVMGEVIDTTCGLWRSSCSKVGACAIYDNDSFRIKRHLVETIIKFVQVILIFLAFWFSRHKTDWSTESTFDTNSGTKEETDLMNKEIIVLKPEYFVADDPIYTKRNGNAEMKTFKYNNKC